LKNWGEHAEVITKHQRVKMRKNYPQQSTSLSG